MKDERKRLVQVPAQKTSQVSANTLGFPLPQHCNQD